MVAAAYIAAGVAAAQSAHAQGSSQGRSAPSAPPKPKTTCDGCGAALGYEPRCSYCRRMRVEPSPAPERDYAPWVSATTVYAAFGASAQTIYEPPAPSPAPSFDAGGGGDFGGGGASGEY